MNSVAIRLLSQQLACPQFPTPSEVVSHLCAMQAQDYRMVRWAVLSRTKNASAEAVIKGWMKSNKITIEDKELYSIREIFVRTADGRQRNQKRLKILSGGRE